MVCKGGIFLSNEKSCTYKQGEQSMCAPLALAVVPPQSAAEPAYDPNEAMAKGTLFPGLDLPFMNYVAKQPLERTPMNELSALDFVCHELTLYLDTHKDDAEAFVAWKSFAAMAQVARARYVELYGPVTVSDMTGCETWSWVNDPWPWERGGKEGK